MAMEFSVAFRGQSLKSFLNYVTNLMAAKICCETPPKKTLLLIDKRQLQQADVGEVLFPLHLDHRISPEFSSVYPANKYQNSHKLLQIDADKQY